MSAHSFTGRGRRRHTRRGVRVAERVAKTLITVGGVGTVLAVALILVFLVSVVVPLFRGARGEVRARAAIVGAPGAASARPAAFALDEYQRLAIAVSASGRLTAWRTDDGTLLEERDLFPGLIPSAISPLGLGGELAFGFQDGVVRLGRVGFATRVVEAATEPELAAALGNRAVVVHERALLERLPDGGVRAQVVAVEIGDRLDLGLAGAVVALDRSTRGGGTSIVALDARGRLVLSEIERRENLLTGEIRTDTSNHDLPWKRDAGDPPRHVLLSGGGDVVYLAWPDGILQRHDVREPEHARLAEEVDLVDGEGTLDALAFLIGKTSLVSGDSRGRVRAWFGTKPADARTPDGIEFHLTHELDAGRAAVTALAASARGRIVCVGFADASVRLYHVTSHKLLVETRVESGAAVDALSIGPKEDSMLALAGSRLETWRIDLGHPEASVAALFRPVWYEGYVAPENVWQSTSGTDDFEPKLGLVPLVFGTIKATFYSMIFGVPLALLAAIFTSEFLHKRLKTPLKSMTEMMASLPSVVLGFIAAIIIAPFVQGVVPMVLAAFFTVPFTILLGAYAWQLLPSATYIRWSGLPRFLAIAACVPIGVGLAALAGPWAERAFFAGDVAAWLDHRGGDGVGGWMLLLLPLAALVYALFSGRVLNPWLRRVSSAWDRPRAARFDLLKFALGVVAVFLLALIASEGLDAAGFDPRGGVLDTYVQRNALIVGFVMGFAIIPIVYTLAEDALSSVPAHLRLASLGAGATPWQTAVRVVIPTAMSGLFSAVMIGLGRAVGETMIVLMATGNTPVMSWNLFDGFRTLSANIAVELPEAVRDSTHYRTLFLAALCLFALTFVLNTVAEVVRQRFRKRAYQL